MGIKDDCLYSRNQQNQDSDDNDIWDDTALLKAYDRAVQIAKDQALRKRIETQHKPEQDHVGDEVPIVKGKQRINWKSGSHCRAVYSADGKEYEATINAVLPWKGKCCVRYIGYENEEEVDISSLKPSLGEKIRQLQIEESKRENQESEETVERMEEMETNQSDSNMLPFMMIPPPPPLNMMSQLTSNEGEAFTSMLMSWYMNGYHTGYYQGLMRHKMEMKNRNSYEGRNRDA